MSIIGKQFENKTSGESTKVVSIDGSIAVLENDQRISVERLLDTKHYIEVMPLNESVVNNITSDSNLHNQLFNQIKEISENSINNADNTDVEKERIIINPVESHVDAQRKMGGDVVDNVDDPQYNDMLEKARQDQLGLTAKMKRQTKRVSEIIDGVEKDVIIPVIDKTRETTVNVVAGTGVDITQPAKPLQYDTVNPMFTKMKRTKKVSLKIDIEEMVPGKDLLKMLEEGFEDSVLDYLTDEIAGKVLTDNTIKSQIRKKLHEYVYGKSKSKPKTKRKNTTTKASTKK